MSIAISVNFIEQHAYITKNSFYAYVDNYYREFEKITDTIVRYITVHNRRLHIKRIHLRRYYRIEINCGDDTYITHAYSKKTVKRKIRRWMYKHNVLPSTIKAII